MDESDYADYPVGDTAPEPEVRDAEAAVAEPDGPAARVAATRTWVVSRAGITEARADGEPR